MVYLFMEYLLPTTLPFLAAVYLAGALYPWKVKLQKKGEKRRLFQEKKWTSFVMSALLLLAIGAGLWFFARILGQQLTLLWQNREELLSWEGVSADSALGKVMERLREMLSVDHMVEGVMAGFADSLSSVTDTVGGMVSIVVVFVATYLILKDYETLREAVRKSAFGEVLLALGKDLAGAGGAYLKAQGTIMLVITAICVAALWLTGNPYALLVGIVIGICDALPFIGTSLIFVPWALFEFLQGAYGMGIFYLAIAVITALVRQFMEPKLIGQSVGANPLAVLLSIYLGMQVFGLWGVILGPASAFLIWEIYRFIRTRFSLSEAHWNASCAGVPAAVAARFARITMTNRLLPPKSCAQS